jgi:hypothetical protein
MPKYEIPGCPPVLPQLRPEFAVRTRSTTWHRHDGDFLDNPSGLRDHIDEEHDGDCALRKGPLPGPISFR